MAGIDVALNAVDRTASGSRAAARNLGMVADAAGDIDENAKDARQSLSDAFSTASTGALIAGAAILGPLALAVGEASDLGESINAVSKIFGEGAADILAYGESAASAVGLSQASFNELAVPLGALLSNVGLSADETAAQTIALTMRAADLASVFNTDVSTALEAINSGLKGEADPLEQFGIGLSAASLQAFALSQGIQGNVSDLSESEKANLRIALIMEQSASVAGDFAETNDGLANCSARPWHCRDRQRGSDDWRGVAAHNRRRVRGCRAASSPTIGEWVSENQELVSILVPVVAGLGLVLGTVGLLGIAIPALSAGWGALTTIFSLSTVKTIAGNIALAARTVLTIAGTAATLIATIATTAFGVALTIATGPIGLVVLAIVGLIAGIVLLVKNWDIVSAAVGVAVGFIRDRVVDAFTTVRDFIGTAMETVRGFVSDNWDKILAILFPIPGLPILIIRNWGAITEVIGGIFNAAADQVKGAANAIIGFINAIIGAWNRLEFRFGGQRIQLPVRPKLHRAEHQYRHPGHPHHPDPAIRRLRAARRAGDP